MHPLNVFNDPKLPLRYPSNWIKIIRMKFRDLEYAYQRVTRGVADCDYWDLDHYFLRIFVQGLDLLREKCHGYPGDEEFDTPEKWDAYLKEMRDCFWRADETNEYYPTPKGDLWWKSVQAGEEDPDMSKAMCDEEMDNQHKRELDLDRGLAMMGHVFFAMWD